MNNYNFHAYKYGQNKSIANYGMSVKGIDGIDYYDILREVIELEYKARSYFYRMVLFKCGSFDSMKGVNTHEQYKLVDINHTKKYPKYDPFVLASQVMQVYFTPHPSTKNNRNQ